MHPPASRSAGFQTNPVFPGCQDLKIRFAGKVVSWLPLSDKSSAFSLLRPSNTVADKEVSWLSLSDKPSRLSETFKYGRRQGAQLVSVE